MQCHMPDQALTGAWVSKDIVAFEQSISVKDELCGATIQLMDSVVFILDLSRSGGMGKVSRREPALKRPSSGY